MTKKYCVLGFGNNFFYPFGSDSREVPQNLLHNGGGKRNNNNDNDGSDEILRVDLLPINPDGKISDANEEHDISSSTTTAKEWLQSQLVSNNNNNTSSSKFSSKSAPILSCGATHTS